jgi:hypothetical protein
MSSRALKCCAIFNRMFEKVEGRLNRLMHFSQSVMLVGVVYRTSPYYGKNSSNKQREKTVHHWWWWWASYLSCECGWPARDYWQTSDSIPSHSAPFIVEAWNKFLRTVTAPFVSNKEQTVLIILDENYTHLHSVLMIIIRFIHPYSNIVVFCLVIVLIEMYTEFSHYS